ncbi:hypothetical protein BCE33L3335 [Bacillus cereus E33L]|uniref:Uncharacterized protein n=1 Tax=Bacillus cereus (strain ZK / E33L) TaxID=288681 RepID=Q637J7_BACCZ|nr:hypothetical protein BCE33L3335 [Bacillus cereus E33L]
MDCKKHIINILSLFITLLYILLQFIFYPINHLNIQTRFVTLLLDTSFNLQYEKKILIKLQGGEMYD